MEESSKYRFGSDDYLIDLADRTIAKLVKEKTHLFKAYNYYLGFRDRYLFKHLEENYGVGNPTSIKFTPLVRKHIDAIVGEYLTQKIQPRVSCKDNKTLTNIMRDKLLLVLGKKKEWVKLFLDNAVYEAIHEKHQLDELVLDPVIEAELKEIEDSVNRNFISDYEIAALIIIEYVLNSRSIDFKNKIRQLLLDYLCTGEAYYLVEETPSKHNFQISTESPLNTFVFTDHDSRYMKNGTRSVVRHWLTKNEIAIKYGKDLTKEDFESLDSQHIDHLGDEDLVWIAAVTSRGLPRTPGILAGTEVSVLPNDIYDIPYELIPVYDIEWIDYDKKKEKGVLFKVTRIGQDIYILDGENKNAIKTIDDPDNVRLSINGLHYTNRGVPYSLMLATADLQDLYDLLLYQKDNLIALGGPKGANIDVAHLPEFLGENMKERVLKYQAYRKAGLAFFDSSLEGEVVNTAFGGYDDTVSPNAIQAIQMGILIIEDTVSSITGVFRERLGGIQLRDAVANVEAGMLQSYIISKQYHQDMETIISEILVDAINTAKRVFKKGQSGELILGDQKQIFTLLPENFTFTDYDIHLADSKEIIQEQQLIQQFALELTKGNMVDPVDLVTIASSKSLTEMKELILKSAMLKKKENNQIGQLQQQLQQAEENSKKLQQQLEQTTKKLAQLNQEKLAIERADNETKNQIEWYKVKEAAEAKKQELDLIKDRNKLEAMQLIDDNPNNDEVLDRRR